MMNQGYDQVAEALVFVHGSQAEIEAARHAALCERFGDSKAARLWRQVQRTIHDLELPLAA
ncbi:MAG: hypothetical protein HY245_02240 [Rhizobiales bacterium]|nr:hypothetical protein [Hyphomicrobiales bacterium]MBI3672248.1 hypothetical protein [Hyphomicrobiales bacterium]